MASTVVTTFAQLKAAAQDPLIDTVYVNSDITLEAGGILLAKNKPSLVIDCFYPQDETGTTHSITDYPTSSQSDSIRIEGTSGAYHLTLRNCEFVGKNYYGAISCVYTSLQADTVLTLENVQYSGPQAAYNRHGTVEVKDCSLRIGPYNGTTVAVNEAVEANRVVLKGEVLIHHDGTPNSCFYMTEGSPRFTIAEGANVSVETTGRELMYGTYPAFVQEQNSRLYLNTQYGLMYAGQSVSGFTLGENAEFILEQKARYSGVPSIFCHGNFAVAAGSRLIIKRTFNASEPLIAFNITATASFSDPDAVILYNAAGRVISWTSGTGTLQISSDTVNYWLTAADLSIAGSYQDEPLYNWFKADGTLATIGATLSTSTTTAVTTNLIAGVDTLDVPSTTTFNVQNARVLSMGRLPLTVDEIHDIDTTIHGTSVPSAHMRYGTPSEYHYTYTEPDAEYTFYLPTPMQKFSMVMVSSNIDFKFKSVDVYAEGSLSFLILPQRLPFQRMALPVRNSRTLLRIDPDWEIVVRDSRENGGTWSLYANAPLPMSNGSTDIPNSLIFSAGTSSTSIEGSNIVKIYTGQGNTSPDFTDTHISWTSVRGFLMLLQSSITYQAGHYEAVINFTLEED